jgi:hypothetical protein
MNETIKRDIIDIIHHAIAFIKANDSSGLKELSNHTIHNASIFQDEFSVSIAVIVYSLSKIIGDTPEHNQRFIRLLSEALRWIEADNLKRYKKTTESIMSIISSIDSEFGRFVDDVISQAQIKKGGKIYDHGISMGQAASILGISHWELMQYAGQLKGVDYKYERPDVIEKLKFTRRLFE